MGFGVTLANATAAGVDVHDLSRFEITQGEEPDLGQLPFGGALGDQGHHIVPVGEAAKRQVEVGERVVVVVHQLGHQEVREEDHHTTTRHHAVEVFEGVRHVGAMTFEIGLEDLRHQSQCVLAAFGGRDERLDSIGEEEEADAVLLPRRGEGQRAGDLRQALALASAPAAEVARRAHVEGQEDLELAFGAERLEKGPARSGGDVPVDLANVVARHVLTDLLEVHARAAEEGAAVATQGLVDEPSGTNLDGVRATEDALELGVSHDLLAHGMGCWSTSAATRASAFIRSASAS